MLESGGWIPILGRPHQENQNFQQNQSIDEKRTKNLFENTEEKKTEVDTSENARHHVIKKHRGKNSNKHPENQHSNDDDYKSSHKKQKLQKLELYTKSHNFNLKDKSLSAKTSRMQEQKRLQRDFMEDDVQPIQEQKQEQEQEQRQPDKLSQQDYWNKFWNNVPR